MRRVLVVDDEPHIRTVLRGYLQADGFEVAEAADGAAALAAMRDQPPDLVLLDVMMPGIDGLEVLRQLRTFSDVYVILVTARAEEVDKLVGLGVGADDYVTKPFSPREVTARVKAVLRRDRGIRAIDGDPLRFDGLTIDTAGREVDRERSPSDVVQPGVRLARRARRSTGAGVLQGAIARTGVGLRLLRRRAGGRCPYPEPAGAAG